MPSPANLDVEVTVDTSVRLPEGIGEASIASLVTHVLGSEGGEGWWQIGIQFMDDAGMQAAHAEYMGIDTSTDIMTFPFEDDGFDFPGDDAVPQGRGGDLMISVDRAAEHAVDAGWSIANEIFYLVAHGVLHILGWDDTSDTDRARMLNRQTALMDSWVRL